MPITERLMAVGDFSIDLNPAVWRTIPASTAGLDWIVVTPARFRGPADFADLAPHAIYCGVIQQIARDGTSLAGDHILGRLGDANGKGPWSPLTSPMPGFDTWTNCITDVFATGDTAEISLGSFFSAPGAPLWDGWQDYEAPRTAIDRWRKQVTAEYRVNPDATFDSGTAAAMFRTGEVLLSPLPLTRQYDVHTRGLHGTVKVNEDWRDAVEHVYVQGNGVGVTSFSGGANIDRYVKVDWPESSDSGAILDRAEWERTEHFDDKLVFAEATASIYAPGRFLTPGDTIDVWDPRQGLVDITAPMRYAGAAAAPLSARCLGMTSAIERGMGVHVRHLGTDDCTDIADFVRWESAPTRLELSPPYTLGRALGLF